MSYEPFDKDTANVKDRIACPPHQERAMSSESKVGGLPAKWRAMADLIAQYDGETAAVQAYSIRERADDLEAALSAHGQPVVDEAMVRGWRNRFISAQTELNQRANGSDYELARAYAEATANEYEAALTAALTGATSNG